MSKSLKNFITIQQALSSYTARQIRFFFLSHDWRGTLDYSQRSMQEAVELEKTFNEFFLLLKSELQQLSAAPADFSKLTEAENGLLSALDACKRAVHMALCDSIDTVRGRRVGWRGRKRWGRQPLVGARAWGCRSFAAPAALGRCYSPVSSVDSFFFFLRPLCDVRPRAPTSSPDALFPRPLSPHACAVHLAQGGA